MDSVGATAVVETTEVLVHGAEVGQVTGVEVVTGRVIVHGQSVMVKVVASVMV